MSSSQRPWLNLAIFEELATATTEKGVTQKYDLSYLSELSPSPTIETPQDQQQRKKNARKKTSTLRRRALNRAINGVNLSRKFVKASEI